MTIAGSLFFLFLGLLVIYAAIVKFKKVYLVQKWPTVKGRIIFNQTNSDNQGYKTQGLGGYHEKIKYEYIVNRINYTSDKICLESFSSSRNRIYFRKIANKYPLGKEVTVYYNPSDPQLAILEPYIRGAFLIFFIGVFWVTLVLFLIIRHFILR